MLPIISMFLLFFMVVLVHEGGHFVAAKLAGMAVPRFAIGFGPKIFSFTAGGTEYQIRLLPLGGFVDIPGTGRKYGRELMKNRFANWLLKLNRKPAGQRKKKSLPRRTIAVPVISSRLFCNKSPLAQLGVIAAGPLVNLAVAFVLCLVLAYSRGQIVFSTPLTVGAVEDRAGIGGYLKVDDVIVSVDRQPVEKFEQFALGISKCKFKAVELEVRRNGKLVALTEPKETASDMKKIGVVFYGSTNQVTAATLIPAGAEKFAKIFVLNLQGLKMLVTGEIPLSSVSSSVGIMHVGSKMAAESMAVLLPFAVMINIGIAIFNLLPILPLDGGRLALIGLKVIRGRELSEPVEYFASMAMTYPIILLSVGLLIRDVFNLF